MKIPPVFFLVIAVIILFGADAYADGQVIIEESITSEGNVGGGVIINNGRVGAQIRVHPETRIERRTTITTYGNINVYTYRPGCEAPCNYRYCYPNNHPCYPCNRYQSPPCPEIVIRK